MRMQCVPVFFSPVVEKKKTLNSTVNPGQPEYVCMCDLLESAFSGWTQHARTCKFYFLSTCLQHRASGCGLISDTAQVNYKDITSRRSTTGPLK